MSAAHALERGAQENKNRHGCGLEFCASDGRSSKERAKTWGAALVVVLLFPPVEGGGGRES